MGICYQVMVQPTHIDGAGNRMDPVNIQKAIAAADGWEPGTPRILASWEGFAVFDFVKTSPYSENMLRAIWPMVDGIWVFRDDGDTWDMVNVAKELSRSDLERNIVSRQSD